MILRRVGAPLIVMMCSLFSAAGAAPAELAPSETEVRELLQANGTDDIGAQVGPITAQQLIVSLRRSNPNLPARADAVITDVVVSYLREHAKQDNFTDKLIHIYAKHLTRTEVQQITKFYRSPVGRKLVSVTPQISSESAAVGTEWMESILPGLQSQLLNRLKSEKLV